MRSIFLLAETADNDMSAKYATGRFFRSFDLWRHNFEAHSLDPKGGEEGVVQMSHMRQVVCSEISSKEAKCRGAFKVAVIYVISVYSVSIVSSMKIESTLCCSTEELKIWDE
jgi:hypothetical protein